MIEIWNSELNQFVKGVKIKTKCRYKKTKCKLSFN